MYHRIIVFKDYNHQITTPKFVSSEMRLASPNFEKNIQLALAYFNSNRVSIRAAAEAFSISKSSLHRALQKQKRKPDPALRWDPRQPQVVKIPAPVVQVPQLPPVSDSFHTANFLEDYVFNITDFEITDFEREF